MNYGEVKSIITDNDGHCETHCFAYRAISQTMSLRYSLKYAITLEALTVITIG